MLSIRDAIERMLPCFPVLEATSLPIDEALGRVLASDVIARFDLPEFDNSAMDGYALRASDVSAAGLELPLVKEARAGGGIPDALVPGHAMRIFTGAPLPSGADAVVMQENTTRTNHGVVIQEVPKPRAFVRYRGSDMRAGAVALAAGTVLGAGEIGLLAAQDQARVSVHRVPRVAILCTGDELRELGAPHVPGTVINSNAHAIAAAVRAAGAEPVVLATARDRLEDIEDRVREGLVLDALITLGGVSVGDYDFVTRALQSAGVSLDFHKVAIKPGKPMLFGRHEQVPVIGLPGNPVSALVTFELFVRPGLLRMRGLRAPFPRSFAVELAQACEHAPDRTELVRASLHEQGGRLIARLHARQGSGSLPSMVGVDALVILPRGTACFDAGISVRALRIADVPCSTTPPIDDRA